MDEVDEVDEVRRELSEWGTPHWDSSLKRALGQPSRLDTERMPLLRSLVFGRAAYYKHGAPYGAYADARALQRLTSYSKKEMLALGLGQTRQRP